MSDQNEVLTILAEKTTFVIDASLLEIDKDPDSKLPYILDWGEWLDERGGESIDTVVWTITGPDSALVEVSTGGDGRRAIIYLSGGTDGGAYLVACRITTTGSPSLTDERSLAVTVIENNGVFDPIPTFAFTVLDGDGNEFKPGPRVLNSASESFAVSQTVLNGAGTGFEVI